MIFNSQIAVDVDFAALAVVDSVRCTHRVRVRVISIILQLTRILSLDTLLFDLESSIARVRPPIL